MALATRRGSADLSAAARAAAGHGCAVERALAIVGAKWTLVILHDLMDGSKRFGELQRLIPAASPKMLSERLRELAHHGLLTRTVHPEVPPRVEYALTEAGRTVWPIVHSLDEWGRKLKATKPGTRSPSPRPE